MLRLRLCLCLCLLLCTGVRAQKLEYYTVNDGLSSPEINHLHLGSDGFLWLATEDGLNRFDGQRFRRVAGDAGAGPALSRGGIKRIAEDQEGQFIVTYQDFNGIFDRYDPSSGAVEAIRLTPSTGVLGYPRTIVTDRLGRTFIVAIGATGTILYEYTPARTDGVAFTPIYRDSTDAWKSLAPRVELLPLSNGQFLLHDEEHGFRHLSATGELLSRPLSQEPVVRRIFAMAEAGDGSVYLSFRDGYPLFRYYPDRGVAPVPVAGPDDGLDYTDIYRDAAGQLLLVGTEDFLGDLFPTEYGLIDTLGNWSLFEAGMPTGRLVSAAAALNFRESVYFGLREGLGAIERRVSGVRNYLSLRPGEDDLDRHRIVALAATPRGRVFALDEGQLYTCGAAEERLDSVHLVSAADTTEHLAFRGGAGLLYDSVAGQLWISAQVKDRSGEGLLLNYDLRTGLARSLNSPYGLGALAFGPGGQLYVAAEDSRLVGLLLELKGEELVPCPVTQGGLGGGDILAGFPIKSVTTINGRVLLGTAGKGVLRYDPVTARLSTLPAVVKTDEEGDPAATGTAPPEGFTVFTFHQPTSGEYLVGTDAGLWLYRSGSGWRAGYSRTQGLSGNEVYGIVPVPNDGYWLSTNNGLTRLPPDMNEADFRRYYRADGLASNRLLPAAALRSADGRYFFGTDNGLTVFQEDDFSRQGAGADVMLTEVSIFGRSELRRLERNLGELRQVTLSPTEKSIAISFALPAGQRPGGSRFRYRLEGFNEDWVPLVNEQTVRFNNLGSGSYVLRIQGAGANGNFGLRETQLTINVRQYLIEKLWFQATLALTFAGLLFYIVMGRLRERLRNERLRTQLSADIHDEVSGLLAGITLQAELLQNRTQDEVLKERLSRVGEAGRTAMSKMSDVIWSIDSRRDTIGNLLQRMQEHADEVLLPLDIRYDFRASGFDEKRRLPGNIRQDIYFIFKEAVNNIARHSTATRVQIELENSAQFFEMFIQDNGQPRTGETSVKTGQGRDNLRMRAGRLRGELVVDDREGYALTLRMQRI